MGFRGIPMPGAERTAVCIVGNKGPVDDYRLLMLDGVKEAIPSQNRSNWSVKKPNPSPQ